MRRYWLKNGEIDSATSAANSSWCFKVPGKRSICTPGSSANYANLSLTDLTLAKLNNVCLVGANLRDCNLSGINFSHADLTNVNLRSAVLKNANLSHSKMKFADFKYADLLGANISGVEDDTYLGGTIMPDGSVHNED